MPKQNKQTWEEEFKKDILEWSSEYETNVILREAENKNPLLSPDRSDLFTDFTDKILNRIKKNFIYKEELKELLDDNSLKDKSNGRYNREVELRNKADKL